MQRIAEREARKTSLLPSFIVSKPPELVDVQEETPQAGRRLAPPQLSGPLGTAIHEVAVRAVQVAPNLFFHSDL